MYQYMVERQQCAVHITKHIPSHTNRTLCVKCKSWDVDVCL